MTPTALERFALKISILSVLVLGLGDSAGRDLSVPFAGESCARSWRWMWRCLYLQLPSRWLSTRSRT